MNYTPAPTVEEDFVNLVRLELDDIKHSFFKIGFRLREANNNRYYLKLGFENITDCAEALFGFKKTTTYDLMNVASLFADSKAPMHLDKRYDGYNQSQLVLLSQINLSQRNFINMTSPSDSITNLKKAKSYWNKLHRGNIQGFLGYGKCKSIDEFIEHVEAINPDLTVASDNTEPIQLTTVENSGYPEKSKDIPQDPPETVPDPAEEVKEEAVSEWDKKLSQHLMEACTKMMVHMSYITVFDPDNKGMGYKVMPEDLSKTVIETVLETFQNNRTVIKNLFKNYIANRLSQFNYEIILCGNKQGITPFCGNIASYIMDFFCDEWTAMMPPQKEKKGRKKK